jgi:hypothetical protein
LVISFPSLSLSAPKVKNPFSFTIDLRYARISLEVIVVFSLNSYPGSFYVTTLETELAWKSSEATSLGILAISVI